VCLQCQLTVVPALADYEWRNSVAPKLGVDSLVQNLNASLAIQLAHSWLSQSQGHIKGTAQENKLMQIFAKLINGIFQPNPSSPFRTVPSQV
jgi:hypothetical protein